MAAALHRLSRSTCFAACSELPDVDSGYYMFMSSDPQDFTIVFPDQAEDSYAGSAVPGEFRRLTELLAAEQVALTFIRVPPHSDFEQGTGHFHDHTEELYLVTKGRLTMRFGDEVSEVHAPAAVRVAPHTPRSHRNEGDEPVEMWAMSRKQEGADATKIDDFWQASPQASQQRNGG
jgi:mannose-6-phosphate isomerase-like protein (cupin superfamily)